MHRSKPGMHFLCVAVLMAGSGCSTTIGPALVKLSRSSQKPVLQLGNVQETLTGTWATQPQVTAFKSELLSLFRQPEAASLLSTDLSNLTMHINLVSDHANDQPRLIGLGCASILTLGIIPLHFHSEWNVQCEVTIRMANEQVVARYPIQVTGTYDIWTFPPTMFALLGAGIVGDASWRETRGKVANNLAAEIMKAVTSDYAQLAKWKESNALLVARRRLPAVQVPRPARELAGRAELPERPRLSPEAPDSVAGLLPPAPAPVQSGHVWMVCVGISEYQDLEFPYLPYAAKDAEDVYALLGRHSGTSRDRTRLLTNAKATKEAVEAALEGFLSKAGKDDLILLYWSGHGFPDPADPSKVYFACHDTILRRPYTGYRMDRVRGVLEEKEARHTVVFADTCHAAKLITRGGKGITGVAVAEAFTANEPVPSGMVFMVAADADRKAIEDSVWSNGAFTHVLLEGLRGKADGFQAAGALDSVVTVGELRAYLLARMPIETDAVFGKALHPVIAVTTGHEAISRLRLANVGQ